MNRSIYITVFSLILHPFLIIDQLHLQKKIEFFLITKILSISCSSRLKTMASNLAPYAKDHETTNGPGDARPTALKVIRDQGLDGKLTSKVFFVSGGTNGIGVETARAIHVTGADVFITGQNRERGLEVVEKIASDGKPGRVELLQMHLDSLDSIREAAKKFLELSGGKVNVLIENAGMFLQSFRAASYHMSD